MKTDRELLELAAKAAGISLSPFQCRESDSLYLSDSTHWNPLTDDGDALRLAVKLKIDIKHYEDHVVCWYEDFFGTGKIFYGGDPDAATRRAIVRAAADIATQAVTEKC